MPDYHNILDSEGFGNTQAERELLWGAYHQHIVEIAGTGGFTVPMGDPNHENPKDDPDPITVTGMGSGFPILTYKPGTRTAFDAPLYYLGPGRIPVLPFNGMDEYLEAPDASFWTHQDWSGTNGFGLVFWANVITGEPGLERTLLSKWGSDKEWLFGFRANDKLQCIIRDNDVDVQCSRLSDAAVTMGAMTMFGVTYAGIGGADAGNYITLYENGVQIASTPTNNASYVGMRNTAALPMIGRNAGAGGQNWFIGEIAGGSFGPLHTKDVISAAMMKQLFHLGRSAMAL